MSTENEKQLTALTEFIIELERRLAIIQSENTELREQMISNILVDADRYLATERQQLIDFGSECIAEIELSEVTKTMKDLSKQIFNNTFKTQ